MNAIKAIIKPFSPLIGTGIGNSKVVKKLLGWMVSIMPKQAVKVETNGYKMSINIGGNSGLDCLAPGLLSGRSYEPTATEVFKQIVKPGMTVVDIGAHTGYYSLLAAKNVGVGGMVFAFEPDPINYAGLVKNIELNGFTNIEPSRLAIGSYIGKGRLYVSGNSSGESSLVNIQERPKCNIGVKVMTLDEALRYIKVDVVKIDVDGGEMDVILGAENIIDANPNIKIITEIWKPGLEAAGYDCVDYWFALRYGGFKYIYLIDERRGEITQTYLGGVLRYVDKYQGVNLLCCKGELEWK